MIVRHCPGVREAQIAESEVGWRGDGPAAAVGHMPPSDTGTLALIGEDHGREREITLRQRDIVRLTVMSRSAVAGGISTLAAEELIRIGDDNSERFSGLVHVPDVDRLKDYALSEVREKQVRPLLPSTRGYD